MRTTGPQLWLVAAGIALGYLARIILGGPATELEPLNSFTDPIVEPEEETIDLPIIGEEPVKDGSGLVPPIVGAGQITTGVDDEINESALLISLMMKPQCLNRTVSRSVLPDVPSAAIQPAS